MEQLLKQLGYIFRSLSFHSNGKWTAKAGKKSGGFLCHGNTPKEALQKLLNKSNKRIIKALRYTLAITEKIYNYRFRINSSLRQEFWLK